MEQFGIDEHILIVKTHYKDGKCYAETVYELCIIFGSDNAPTATTILRFVQKFKDLSQLQLGN